MALKPYAVLQTLAINHLNLIITAIANLSIRVLNSIALPGAMMINAAAGGVLLFPFVDAWVFYRLEATLLKNRWQLLKLLQIKNYVLVDNAMPLNLLLALDRTNKLSKSSFI